MSFNLLSLPGLYQFRRATCCLACGLKDFGLHDELLNLMLARRHRVSDLLEGTVEEIEVLLEPLRREKRRAIDAIAQSLIEIHRDSEPPLIHAFYYRINELEIRHRSSIGKIRRGEVLEIFQRGTESGVTEDIFFNLRRDFLDMKKRPHLYPDLPSEDFESCVTISINEELSSIYCKSPRQGRMNFMVPSIPVDAQIRSCESFLRECQGVSMILIRDVVADAENAPAIRDWIRILDRVYGSLKNMIVVFMIKYRDFEKFGVKKKSEVRKMVNRNLPTELQNSIKYVDVTSCSDLIMDKGPRRELVLKNL